jgi:hypothetical protein
MFRASILAVLPAAGAVYARFLLMRHRAQDWPGRHIADIHQNL